MNRNPLALHVGGFIGSSPIEAAILDVENEDGLEDAAGSVNRHGSMHACNHQSVDLTYFRTTAANLAAAYPETDAHMKEHSKN